MIVDGEEWRVPSPNSDFQACSELLRMVKYSCEPCVQQRAGSNVEGRTANHSWTLAHRRRSMTGA